MRLTTRDIEILAFLSEQGVATFAQIREAFFPSDVSAYTRLHILKKHAFIESVPVSALKTYSSSSAADWQDLFEHEVSQEIGKYRVYKLGLKFQNKVESRDYLSQVFIWKHQIRLHGIARILKGIIPHSIVLKDSELREQWRRYKLGGDDLIPDLVFQGDGMSVAIEYERNLKAESIYFSRFLQYRDSEYKKIIYICETERIFRKVTEYATTNEKIGIAMIIDPKKIFRSRYGYQHISQFINT